MSEILNSWRQVLVCPVDRSPLSGASADGPACPACGFRPAEVQVGGRYVPDFRALDVPQRVTQTFDLPVVTLDRYELVRTMFRAPNQDFAYISPREVRERFGTKLDKGIQFYCQRVLREAGADAPILDLGCGSGGNRRYLQTLGFKNILTVDWSAAGADLLADAHRLPLADASFQMVISTAVFEHFYNPFLAMAEVGRVLRPGGCFVGGASFWEGWHGSSFFHLTPDGCNALLTHGGLHLEDLWTGLGVMPALFSHVITPGHLRGLGYALQRMGEGLYRLFAGEAGVRRLYLRGSGAYIVCATRKA